MGIDFVNHLRRDSERFAKALARVAPTAPVPCCPEWRAVDLAWHLAEVQWFWGTIVAERLTDPAPAEASKPNRPDDYQAILDLLAAASDRLVASLEEAAPDTPVWTWDDHTVGWVRRRQAHEALIHRVDAEMAAGESSVVDTGLALDGIDEILRVQIGGVPDWATFEPDGATVSIRSGGRSWRVAFGRMRGTGPESGKYYELDAVEVEEDEADAGALVEGSPEAVDLWLWGRGSPESLTITGEPALAQRLRKLAAEAT